MEALVVMVAIGTLLSFPVVFAFLVVDAIRERKARRVPVSGR